MHQCWGAPQPGSWTAPAVAQRGVGREEGSRTAAQNTCSAGGPVGGRVIGRSSQPATRRAESRQRCTGATPLQPAATPARGQPCSPLVVNTVVPCVSSALWHQAGGACACGFLLCALEAQAAAGRHIVNAVTAVEGIVAAAGDEPSSDSIPKVHDSDCAPRCHFSSGARKPHCASQGRAHSPRR